MSEKKRSSVIGVRSVINLACNISAVLKRDQVMVFAAQASFFLILSAIPFLMLTLSLSQILVAVSSEDIIELIESFIPQDILPAFASMIDQLTQTGSVSLLSITAFTALWSASRGMAAVERGISGVYGINVSRGFLSDVIRSILYTAGFIVLILGTLLLLVFGVQIADLIMTAFPSSEGIITKIMNARGLFMFLALSAFFSLEHLMILRRAYRGESRPLVLPGSMLSAAGWMLFSYFYSLYIKYFPRASYLYGGLALLVILMLWAYFCMIILLCGAEINKILFRSSRYPDYISSFYRTRQF